MKNRRPLIIAFAVVLLLLVPLVAMQFTHEVDWSLEDFLVAGALLLCTGLLGEFVIRKVSRMAVRIALCAALVVILFLTWAELAVGVFGTPFAGS